MHTNTYTIDKVYMEWNLDSYKNIQTTLEPSIRYICVGVLYLRCMHINSLNCISWRKASLTVGDQEGNHWNQRGWNGSLKVSLKDPILTGGAAKAKTDPPPKIK